jgi:hypothetical protein
MLANGLLSQRISEALEMPWYRSTWATFSQTMWPSCCMRHTRAEKFLGTRGTLPLRCLVCR